MGYVMPAETLTLLEGYEDEADSLAARQLQQQQPFVQQSVAAATPSTAAAAAAAAAASGEALPVRAPTAMPVLQPVVSAADQGSPASSEHAEQGPAGALPHAASEAGAAAPQQGASQQQQQQQQAQGESPATDPADTRFMRQMREAYLRTQQLRTMIEWGRSAMGRYHPGEA